MSDLGAPPAEAVGTGPAPRRFRRGIALLPALITTGNLFCGFSAIVRVIHGHYHSAAALILAAVVLDMADGRLARMTGTASEFGGELDSLADAISFGVAPAILAYCWGMLSLPRAGWLVAFFFAVGGVLRLARFNVQRHVVDGRYFVGLPIPAAAVQLCAIVLVAPSPFGARTTALLMGGVTLALAILMVSTLRYASFKKLDLKSRRSYVVVLAIAGAFLLVAWRPTWALLGAATVYTLSGPLAYLVGLVRRRGSVTLPSVERQHVGI